MLSLPEARMSRRETGKNGGGEKKGKKGRKLKVRLEKRP